MEQFRPLEKEYKKNGFIFREVKREDLVAMYSQHDPEEEMKQVGFEVFEVIQMPAGFAGPARYPQPAREVPPNNESWGTKAFSPSTRAAADSRFKELKERLSNREVERGTATIEKKKIGTSSNASKKRSK